MSIKLLDGQTGKETVLVPSLRLSADESKPIKFTIPDGYVSIVTFAAESLGDSKAEEDSHGVNGITLGVRLERSPSKSPPYEANYPGYIEQWTLTLDMTSSDPGDNESEAHTPAERAYREAKARQGELAAKKNRSKAESEELTRLNDALTRAEIERELRERDYEEEVSQFQGSAQPRGSVSPVYGKDGAHLDPGKVHNYLVTGVGTTSVDSGRQAAMLSQATGQAVKSIANSTGSKLADVRLPAQTGADLKHAIAHDPTAIEVADAIARAVESGKAARLWAHSKGARDVQIGLWRYTARLNDQVADGSITDARRAELLSSIKVMTLGGADPESSEWPPGVSVYTVRNPGDPIPKLFGSEGGTREAVRGAIKLPSLLAGGEALTAHILTTYIEKAPPGGLRIP